jgi:hypothetical protein
VTHGRTSGHGAQHLIGDVQRFGLLSAAAVVDRYTEIADRATRDASLPLAPLPPDERAAGWLVDSASRIAEASLNLIDTTAALLANTAPPDRPVPEMERVVLPSTRPGFHSQTSLWVHNRMSSVVTYIDLHMTSLISSMGASIPVSAVSVSPGRLDLVDAGTAREVRLRVEVPAGQPAGDYHGLVLISAAPLEPIALHLVVDGPERTGDDSHQ